MKPDESIYTARCIIMRENEQKGYSWMWMGKPELLPSVAITKVAATIGPPLDPTKAKYKDPKDRTLVRDKMRTTLRIAGDHIRNLRLEPWVVEHFVTHQPKLHTAGES